MIDMYSLVTAEGSYGWKSCMGAGQVLTNAYKYYHTPRINIVVSQKGNTAFPSNPAPRVFGKALDAVITNQLKVTSYRKRWDGNNRRKEKYTLELYVFLIPLPGCRRCTTHFTPL